MGCGYYDQGSILPHIINFTITSSCLTLWTFKVCPSPSFLILVQLLLHKQERTISQQTKIEEFFYSDILTMSAQKPNVLNSCDSILHSIRSSNLHFVCQQTPFTLYLTIRKSSITFPIVNEAHTKRSEKADVNDILFKSMVEENRALNEELEALATL
jgi:hypothetical protein